MRHLRMVGLVSVLALALSAMSAVPALAAEESTKEKAEWVALANCPVNNNPEPGGCVWAQSTYKEHFLTPAEAAEYHETHPELHSEFHAGNVTVNLKLPITLRGGFNEDEFGQQHFIGAEGTDTLQPVPQKAPPLTKDVDTSLLSESELKRYNYFVKVAKETKTTATVELAGPPTSIILNEENLLGGEGTALGLPVKVKLNNPFFGNNCSVGTNEHPIQVELTAGTSGALTGKLGTLTTSGEARLLTVRNDTIVDNAYAAPGVEGCGVSGGADAAINAVLGLPSPSGANTAVIDGTLKQAGIEAVREKLGI